MNSSYYRQITKKLKDHREFSRFTEEIFSGNQEGKREKKNSGNAVLATRNERPFDIVATGFHGSFLSLVLTRIHELGQKGMVIVLPTDKEAEHFQEDLDSLGIESLIWPWGGTAPYAHLPSNSPIFGYRMHILTRLIRQEDFMLLVSLRALCGLLPPRSTLENRLISVQVGQSIDPVDLSRKLVSLGYLRVSKVSVPGEFALRGEVLDISFPGIDEAVRIVFEYDKVEEIRWFDLGTQFSHRKTPQVSIHPFRECVWDKLTKDQVIRSCKKLPELSTQIEKIQELFDTESNQFEGEELWYPLAYETPHTLFDYLPPDWVVFFTEYQRLENAHQTLMREFDGVYRKIRHQHPVPKPERLLSSLEHLVGQHPRKVRMPVLRDETLKAQEKIHINSDGPRSFFGNITFLQEELASLEKNGYQIFIIADSQVQKQRIALLLQDHKVTIEEKGLRAGFTLPDLKITLIHEQEIFGRRKRIPKSVHRVRSEAIDSFVDLEPGDFVVHINHGIGKFLGIQRIVAGGTERDYIKLMYADTETVFVPIEQVNLIQKYIGSQGSDPRLDKIGGKSWENRKERVRQKVQDLAEHLLGLYSRRKRSSGFAFPQDTEWQIQFESTFPFEETEDQIRCIEEVKADMEKPLPMDRLVCGDVGFGKTEIAMRAAFKAIASGKQVAFLAPTTILAEQHFEGLEERLQGFPVKVGMLSRFVTKADQRKVLEGVRKGEVDLLVGTHRIVQKDVHFKDLGLMIIDEEQRFGVKDKERLKEIKTSVDSLTLSATPIPRTLHMSLLKIRDMSVLKTPPYNRRPIETHVEAFQEELVAKAIRREVERGGQVFYLHNRVESLESVQLFLERLVPEVLVDVAHGKMGPKDLEDIMHRFIHGGFHVLVATTIIENGINIPNVNTIIIDRADFYGVSQLYQLRGRVGRSDRLAYAYLLYPGERALSEVAMKRLQIISDNTELGSGFKIALKDLEVRGAGNLLGAEQSGEIYSVGFDLYLKLLDEAVRKLANAEREVRKIAIEQGQMDAASLEDLPELVDDQIPETYLELDYTGFIPDTYISDPMEKMEVYKKISSIGTDQELEGIFTEIEDRFGPVPDEVYSLLALAELRILCRKLSIASLKERRGQIEVEFGKLVLINIERLLQMIRSSGGTIKPVPNAPNKIRMTSDGIGLKEKSEFIRGRLSQLLK